MTETSILPGATPSTDAGADMVPPGTSGDESENNGANRRNLLILGAVAGVIILAAAAYMLLHKSPAGPPALTPPPAAAAVHHVAPTKPVHHKASGKGKSNGKGGHGGGTSTLPKVVKQPTVRDPFNALVTPPVVTAGGPSSTTTVTPGSTPTTAPSTAPTAGPQPTTPVTQPTPVTSTSPGTGGKTVGAPLWIQLMKTHGQSATFDVGYAHHKFRRYTVQAPKATSRTGTVFDKMFALIGIQNGQATVQIGDATPFDLTTGISHTV